MLPRIMDRIDSNFIMKHDDASYMQWCCVSDHMMQSWIPSALFVFRVYDDCCVGLPHCATGLSTVCD